jgi:ceramide glucosyltransferase
VLRQAVLAAAVVPLAYYLLAAYAAWRRAAARGDRTSAFVPPVSVLKPIKGLDREAYLNLATFCRQEYPTFELLLAVDDDNDPAIGIVNALIRDFPAVSIRLLVGATPLGTNNKTNKLCRLVQEARYDVLVISDSDVRVDENYLETVVRPLADSAVGAVTTLYRGVSDGQFWSDVEAVGLASDFAAAVLASRHVEEMAFTLGATMVTTRQHLATVGGFEAFVNHCADDFELGSRIVAQGLKVELSPYVVTCECVAPTFRDYFRHQLRWAISTRHSRPFGHVASVLSHGLPWSLAAAAVAPSGPVAAGYLIAFIALRGVVAWSVGVRLLHDPIVRSRWWLIGVRDTVAFVVWITSLAVNRVWWRGQCFSIRNGRLEPVVRPK